MSKPESAVSLIEAGAAEHQAGRRREAKKLYERALRSSPKERRALHLDRRAFRRQRSGGDCDAAALRRDFGEPVRIIWRL
jgi:hypothetical protein